MILSEKQITKTDQFAGMRKLYIPNADDSLQFVFNLTFFLQ